MGSNVIEMPARNQCPVLRHREASASFAQSLAGIPNDLDLEGAARFEVVVTGRPKELSQSLREEVYRIAKEAIVNAYHHSRARKIVAEVQYQSGGLRVAVRDNGCGIDPRGLQWDGAAHWGIREMWSRADRIGARLRILSRLTLGTEVELFVPWAQAFA